MSRQWETGREEKEENRMFTDPRGIGKRKRGTEVLQYDPQAEGSAHPPTTQSCGLKPKLSLNTDDRK